MPKLSSFDSEEVRKIQLHHGAEQAYKTCLTLETLVQDDPDKARVARILGYFVLYAPEKAQVEISTIICSCRADP